MGNRNKDVTPQVIFERAVEVETATIVVTKAALDVCGNLMMLLLLNGAMALLFLDTGVLKPNVESIANNLDLQVETAQHDMQEKNKRA
jgi:hypothetical protein